MPAAKFIRKGGKLVNANHKPEPEVQAAKPPKKAKKKPSFNNRHYWLMDE